MAPKQSGYETKLCANCKHTEYSHIAFFDAEVGEYREPCELELKKGEVCPCMDFVEDLNK